VLALKACKALALLGAGLPLAGRLRKSNVVPYVLAAESLLVAGTLKLPRRVLSHGFEQLVPDLRLAVVDIYK
jgi:hypothetical protein